MNCSPGKVLMRIVIIVLAIAFIVNCLPARAQAVKYYGKKEVVPVIPPAGERIRLLVVSDATNEIDDVWAIALALLYPERFQIEGFVGSNYDHSHEEVGPKSIERAVKE